MGLDSVKSKGLTIASEGPITDLYSKALSLEGTEDYDKDPILRPSGFPTCSILDYLKIVEFDKRSHTKREASLFSSFFTSVGTTVHEVVQTWTGKTNKVLAQWQCVNQGCSFEGCTDKECKTVNCIDPKHWNLQFQTSSKCRYCGSECKYHELEVEYGIITGHVDLIYRVGKGKYWAGDYKTSSVDKLSKIKAPPVNYLMQIMTYAWILKNEYEIPIVGYSIFYIARDKPNLFKEFKYDFDSKAEKAALGIIKEETYKFKAAKSAFKEKNLRLAIDAKPCTNKAHYQKLMGEHKDCPFVDVCFGTQSKLIKAINDQVSKL